MDRKLWMLLWCALLWMQGMPDMSAQTAGEEPSDRSAEVEESDEEYRRRMELEDARQRNLGYTLPPESYAAQQDKLDKLPEASRDNIRDQLVDIIVENGEWEPSDALKEYPYEPTAAARDDPALMEQELAAWDEQIDKYHKREAAAFGTYLGPVPGPGNPDGAEGGAQAGTDGTSGGESPAGEAQGSGTGGSDGAQQDGTGGSAGTYEPYQSSRAESEGEEVSTEGSRQSALDFLRALQGQGEPQAAPPTSPDASGLPAPSTQQPAEQAARQAAAEPAPEQIDSTEPAATAEVDLATPGIIAIEDLDKLEGAESPEGAEDS